MSNFLALNVVEDPVVSKKNLEEEHTREIQIEEAFKLFQEALQLQKRKQYVEAYHVYEKLFKLEVISNHYFEEEDYIKGLQNGGSNEITDELSFLSPNVKSLRYLVFRNRGFLYYHIMKSGIDVKKLDRKGTENDFETSKQMFYSLLDDFTICFLYQEVDEEVLMLIHGIFNYLGLLRLERYTLEYALTNDESTDFISLIPNDKRIQRKMKQFMDRLYECKNHDSNIEKSFNFLSDIRKDLQTQIQKTQQLVTLNVHASSKFGNLTWISLIEGINSAIKQNIDKDKSFEASKSKLKSFEPYLLTETSLERVVFDYPQSDSEKVEDAVIPDSEGDEFFEVKEEIEPQETESKTRDLANMEKDSPRKEINENTKVMDEIPVFTDSVVPKRSLRTRNEEAKDEEFILTKEVFTETTKFFKNLQPCFEKLDLKLTDVVDKFMQFEKNFPLGQNQAALPEKFLYILNHHSKSTFKSLTTIRRTGELEKQKLLDVLTSFELNENNLNRKNIISFESPSEIKKFLQMLTEQKATYKTCKIMILEHLFNYIVPCQWEPKLTNLVKEWVNHAEADILERIKLEYHEGKKCINFELAIVTYELLLDSYISLRNQLSNMRRSKANKLVMSSLHLRSLQLKDKLTRWSLFLEDTFDYSKFEDETKLMLYFRFKWALIFKERAIGDPYDGTVISKMLELLHRELIAAKMESIDIEFPNYENISSLKMSNVESKINTTNILSVFAKILSTSEDSKEAQNLLEDILLEKGTSQTTKNIIMFLKTTHVDMKLTLWNILFSIYQEDDNLNSIQCGFESLLRFLLHYLQNPSLENSDLLSILACYGQYMGNLLSRLQTENWKLSETNNILETLGNLKQMFELFYLFSLHEEAAILSPSKPSVLKSSEKAYNTLKDLFVNTIAIMFIYFQKANKNNQLSHHFAVLLHDQLGLRQLCDSGDGIFLKILQDFLTDLEENKKIDLMQVISCRYHFNIAIDGVIPTNHYTTNLDNLDLASVFSLSKIILPLCFEKNPVFHPPKNDMKTIIDAFYEVVGDAEVDLDVRLQKNSSTLEYFFRATPLEPKFLRDAFHGLIEPPFAIPQDDRYQVIRDGLYFLQALQVFYSYKIRKKSMQSRAVELENVINLLKLDIVFGSNRVESWFLLGQAYGFLVEDDLIWTSDKLIYPERKNTTGNLQRKSLLCYFMAINQSMRLKTIPKLIGSIMSYLAKEMYNACMEPMNMHVFKVLQNPRFIRNEVGASFTTVSDNSPTKKSLCLRIIQQALHFAINNDSENWTNYYYLSKVQGKLQMKPDEVIRTLLIASDLAKSQSNQQDPIIEPHYRLCSIMYKYVKKGILKPAIAFEYIQMDKILKSVQLEEPKDEESFFKYIIECLKKIVSYDKKKWQHKPKFRLAKILFEDFDDTNGAKEEMSSILSLKVTNKTLVSIWKPENERPGKHFLYTYQYAMFYIQLLYKEVNLASLVQMLPKLRRSNSTMVSLSSAWEYLCVTICKVIRSSLEVTDMYTENFLHDVSFQMFVSNSKKLVEDICKDGKILKDYEIYTCLLYAISDMKKLNNGYGPTSLIDDTIVAVYISAYYKYTKSHNLSNSMEDTKSPVAKPKRLAKKDVFPMIADIVKMAKKAVEDILKENHDVYSEFVQTEMKLKEEKRQQEALKKSMSLDKTPDPQMKSEEEFSQTTQDDSEIPNTLESNAKHEDIENSTLNSENKMGSCDSELSREDSSNTTDLRKPSVEKKSEECSSETKIDKVESEENTSAKKRTAENEDERKEEEAHSSNKKFKQ